jgi:RNA polymerase sigma factor (sigma-70 family)
MSRSADRVLDEYLVAAAKCGDKAAFNALVQRWHSKLIAHAWRLAGDRESARDAVQDGWLDIAKGLRGLQDPRAFPAWAYRIISRKCARAIVAKRHTRALTTALEMDATADLQEDQELSHASGDVARLREAIRALPGEQRAAIALYYFEDLSVAEIAVALDAPAGTIKTRLMHARRKLRATMEGVHQNEQS